MCHFPIDFYRTRDPLQLSPSGGPQVECMILGTSALVTVNFFLTCIVYKYVSLFEIILTLKFELLEVFCRLDKTHTLCPFPYIDDGISLDVIHV